MSVVTIDVVANRRARKYGRNEVFRRVLWGIIDPLFRFSPRIAFGWRRLLLRLFGASVARGVHIYPRVRVFAPWMLTIGPDSAVGEDVRLYNLGPLTLGARATVSHGAHLCGGTHEIDGADMKLVRAPICIGDDAWVCADAFVGPGVSVGEGAVVGARAVAVKDVEAWTVVAGNPARVVATRDLRRPDRG